MAIDERIFQCDSPQCFNRSCCVVKWIDAGELVEKKLCRACAIKVVSSDYIYDHDMEVIINDGHHPYNRGVCCDRNQPELPPPYPEGQELWTVLLPLLVLIIIGFVFSHWMGWI